MDMMARSIAQTDEALAVAHRAQEIANEALDERDALRKEMGFVRRSYDELQERMAQEIERAKSPLTAERDALYADAMVMACRLYGESDGTFAPETIEVMKRWRPKVDAVLAGKL
jgi:predicted nuclease with TOPRIM domain